MAKNHQRKKCIHCLKVPDEITEDHVIPKSWFSVNSKNEKKPTAPACFECNNRLGEIEKRLSHLIWLCMPEKHPLRVELSRKAYRAFGLGPDGKPLPDLPDKERAARKAYLAKLIATTELAGNLSEHNLMPGLSFHPGYPREMQRATKLKKDEIFLVAEKVIKGLEYIQGGRKRYIEKPYKLEVFLPNQINDPSLQVARDICRPFFDGTNVLRRGVVPTKPLEPIYIVRVWDLIEIWGVISSKEND